MAGGKGYQGIGAAAGGTPDNTSEGKIPVKKGGAFEDSAIQETAEDIESGKNIVAPTASIKFADALILKSNSDSIEILDCARDEKHALIIDIYDDSGSGPPFQRQLQGITTLDLQLLDDDQNGDFSLIAAAVDDIHLETLIIKPKTAGTGIFSMTDSITGCILNTKTEIIISAGQIDTEVEVVLNNPIILFDNQVIVLNYSGPDLAGHDYVSDPTWGTQFVPFVRTIRQIFITKNIALEEDIITTAERNKLAVITDTGSGDIITVAERNKLGGLSEGRYLGVFADLTALQTAYPTGVTGDHATVISPDNHIWYWDGGAWADSGTGSEGDMLKAVYDPSNIAADAFLMANMVENGTNKILTATERSEIAANTVHKSSDGKDHSDVVANNAKVSFPEAPNDGKQYARKNEAWAEVDTGEVPLFLSLGANDAIFPSSNPAVANSRNGHPVLNYDDTIEEKVIFDSKIQSGYDGEDINVDIDWIAEAATSGAVTWGIEFERNTPGGNDIDSDSFAAQQIGNSTTAGTSGIITRTTITLTQAQADGVIAGDYFRMRVERVTSDGGDNMSDDAQILRIVVRV